MKPLRYPPAKSILLDRVVSITLSSHSNVNDVTNEGKRSSRRPGGHCDSIPAATAALASPLLE